MNIITLTTTDPITTPVMTPVDNLVSYELCVCVCGRGEGHERGSVHVNACILDNVYLYIIQHKYTYSEKQTITCT